MSSEVRPIPTNAIPIRWIWTEILAVGLWTLAADVLVFRIATHLSFAIFLVLAPILYRIAASEKPHRRAMVWCCVLSAMVATRLIWLGSPLTVVAAVILIIAMSMAASGVMPWVLEGLVWCARSIFDGALRATRYRWTDDALQSVRSHHRIASIVLPIAAVLTFGGIFVMANPNLVTWVGAKIQLGWNQIYGWLSNLSAWEAPFCIGALFVGIGLMRPAFPHLRFGSETNLLVTSGDAQSSLYGAYRNTLIAVTALFSLYLGFEFLTLWRRDFPVGFYYAGYAHQGAAWLTIALALATISLSIIFGRSLLSDPRLPQMRIWAWIWSAENLLLALAVYNRLFIYIGYNGLTRMRWVGLLGTTAVVIGFGLVVWKISKNRNFWWLIRSQMLALVLVVIVYGFTPVDYLSHRYNVMKVVSGQEAPSVMLAVKPIDDEGLLALFSLADHSDSIIRDGIRARLAIRQDELEKSSPTHWTEFQGATARLEKKLQSRPDIAATFAARADRDQALRLFVKHTMQWY
jgi:Domain of unknown function (DUF4173)